MYEIRLRSDLQTSAFRRILAPAQPLGQKATNQITVIVSGTAFRHLPGERRRSASPWSCGAAELRVFSMTLSLSTLKPVLFAKLLTQDGKRRCRWVALG